MRASAGSVFRLPADLDEECFDTPASAGIQTLAAMAHTPSLSEQVDQASPTALVIGSEGSGLSPELAAKCEARITIPCPGPVESLNAAVAASCPALRSLRQRAIKKASPDGTRRRP
jgi:TrmH family RNA methyltransferase